MKELPVGWEWTSLSNPEICLINPKKTEVSSLPINTKISFIPMSGVSDEGIILSEEERELNNVIKGYTYFKEGDILFAKITPCMENGKSVIARDLMNGIGFGSTEFHVMRPSENILPEWIFYYIRQEWFRKKAAMHFTGTAGQQRVPTSFLKKEKIPLPFKNGKPDLDKQKKIVAILQKAEHTKRLHEQAEEFIDMLLKSVFYDMFGNLGKNKKGWNESRIGDVTNFIDYRGKTPKKSDYGIRLITAKNVKEGYIMEEPKEFISEEEYDSWMRRGFPKEGDVLFTTEAPLGNVAKLGKFEKVALAQRIITLQSGEDLNSDYLMFCLLSKDMQKRILRYSTGSTVKGIRAKEFSKIFIPIPPIELQDEFTKIVERVKSIQKDLQNSNQESEALFNALLQKAFTGELVA